MWRLRTGSLIHTLERKTMEGFRYTPRMKRLPSCLLITSARFCSPAAPPPPPPPPPYEEAESPPYPVAIFDSAPPSSQDKRKHSIHGRIHLALETIWKRRLPPEARIPHHGSVRSETDLMNVVDQRIFHSMLEGDFENLAGKGKPLKMDCNPHIDPADDLLYKVLARNGFAPEWVALNKDIRIQIRQWRSQLALAWKRKLEQERKIPTETRWKAELVKFEAELREINKKVLHYNLIVPFGRQVFSYKFEEELKLIQYDDPPC